MTFNLRDPSNKEANELAQNQRIASLWANSLSLGKLTRGQVNRLISEYPADKQPALKAWLNNYRADIRTQPKANSKKRRTIPPWVKR
jgi:hypothetical protein